MHGKAPGRISHGGPDARARSAALLRLRAGCVPHPVRRRRRPVPSSGQEKRDATRPRHTAGGGERGPGAAVAGTRSAWPGLRGAPARGSRSSPQDAGGVARVRTTSR